MKNRSLTVSHVPRLVLLLSVALGACTEARVPPENGPRGKLAFRSSGGVSVINVDGTLVGTLPCHMAPSFSPGGLQIACLGTPPQEYIQKFQEYVGQLQERFGGQIDPQRLTGFAFHGGLKVATASTTEVVTLPEQVPYFKLWWSLDGQRILFQSGFGIDLSGLDLSQIGTTGVLFSVKAAGGGLEQLSQPVPLSLDGDASWSHDLLWKAAPAVKTTAGGIAQAPPRSLSLQQRIFLFAASGDQTRQLTTEPDGFGHSNPRFSPDGRLVAYNATRPRSDQPDETENWLYLVDFAGQIPRRVVRGCFVLDWSLDSTRMLLGCRASRIAIYEIPTQTTIDLPTGLSPVFSPDQSWVAYTASIDEGVEIRAVRINGSDDQLIATLPNAVDQLTWGR